MTGSGSNPATLTREQLIKLALMSSKQGCQRIGPFPAGGKDSIYLMNKKALSLGMRNKIYRS